MNNKYLGRKYSIQAYDPSWVVQYMNELNSLKTVLGENTLDIEHIGSTSVPGLSGKPTIDILVTVKEIETADSFLEVLGPQGYKYLGQYVMEGSRLYVKEEDGERLVNLHFYYKGHPHISSMLVLRDYLRTHADVVQEYSNLKQELFTKYPDNYGAYRIHKDEWMGMLIKKLGPNVKTE